MEDNILDSPVEVDNKKELTRLLIPLLILWVGIVWSYSVQGSIFLIASSLTLAASVLFFINKNASFYLVLVILVLGLIKVIYIFPVQILFGIMTIEFDVTCLISLVAILLLNRGRIQKKINSFSTTEETKQSSRASKVNTFKQRFSGKNNEELEMIIRNKSLVEEARIAAQEILSDRT